MIFTSIRSWKKKSNHQIVALTSASDLRTQLLRHKIDRDPDPFGLVFVTAVQDCQRKRSV
ncbi:hypothetical protein GGC03_25215 (plasmid) [Vibrio sp. THAF191c]|jgi:hypothetical protein|nr:hypothetical protein FIU99_25490 [Vibrio sp. THAF64]QGM37749.1 hypothetical protein GGC04_25990 [Vibrio sp. THAF191d]QGN73092.1 hypothetical protein GGC03_25215 [Vibrio sp. THAF191c]